MAQLTVQDAVVSGLTPSYGAVSASDYFVPKGSEKYILHVKNGGGSADSVVINDPNSASPSSATAFNADVTVSVPNGQERMIALDPARFIDPATGRIDITHSFTTSVTCAVVRAV